MLCILYALHLCHNLGWYTWCVATTLWPLAPNPDKIFVLVQVKKQFRSFEKKILYSSRKQLAEKRPRHQGKFMRVDKSLPPKEPETNDEPTMPATIPVEREASGASDGQSWMRACEVWSDCCSRRPSDGRAQVIKWIPKSRESLTQA